MAVKFDVAFLLEPRGSIFPPKTLIFRLEGFFVVCLVSVHASIYNYLFYAKKYGSKEVFGLVWFFNEY